MKSSVKRWCSTKYNGATICNLAACRSVEPGTNCSGGQQTLLKVCYSLTSNCRVYQDAVRNVQLTHHWLGPCSGSFPSSLSAATSLQQHSSASASRYAKAQAVIT
jgi:hypothetical protein